MIELWNMTLHFPTPRPINRDYFSPKKAYSSTCCVACSSIHRKDNESSQYFRNRTSDDLSSNRNKIFVLDKQCRRFFKSARNVKEMFYFAAWKRKSKENLLQPRRNESRISGLRLIEESEAMNNNKGKCQSFQNKVFALREFGDLSS